jgi:hypothetical protein
MKGAHKWHLLVVVLLLGLTSTPTSAISPSAVVVYGGKVAEPILLRPADPAAFPAFGLLWWGAGSYSNPTPLDPQLWTGLKKRSYVKLAIFWGRYNADQLKPENASQHGRFYPATATEPAIVVSTAPDMQQRSNPIPSELETFTAAWTLSPQELSTLKTVGFPVQGQTVFPAFEEYPSIEDPPAAYEWTGTRLAPVGRGSHPHTSGDRSW